MLIDFILRFIFSKVNLRNNESTTINDLSEIVSEELSKPFSNIDQRSTTCCHHTTNLNHHDNLSL